MTGEIIGIVMWRSGRPRAGAVDAGRVVQLGRDALEPGEVDDHAGADPPDAHDHEPRVDPGRVVEPGRRVRDPERLEEQR